MIDFYLPVTIGEWFLFLDGMVTLIVGVCFFLVPQFSLRVFYGHDLGKTSDALPLIGRGLAGFQLGLGLSCILLAQPILWGALGLCWGIAALGRIVSLACDKSKIAYNLLLLTFEIILAFFPLAYFFNIIL